MHTICRCAQGIVSPAWRGIVMAVEMLIVWSERAEQRRMLGALDDRLRSDVGLDCAAIETEIGKPFWRR